MIHMGGSGYNGFALILFHLIGSKQSIILLCWSFISFLSNTTSTYRRRVEPKPVPVVVGENVDDERELPSP